MKHLFTRRVNIHVQSQSSKTCEVINLPMIFCTFTIEIRWSDTIFMTCKKNAIDYLHVSFNAPKYDIVFPNNTKKYLGRPRFSCILRNIEKESFYISHFHAYILIMFTYQNSSKIHCFDRSVFSMSRGYCRVFLGSYQTFRSNERIYFFLITHLYQYSSWSEPNQWQSSLSDWNGELSYLSYCLRANR